MIMKSITRYTKYDNNSTLKSKTKINTLERVVVISMTTITCTRYLGKTKKKKKLREYGVLFSYTYGEFQYIFECIG